jgi:hypothetical protein
MLKEMQQHDNPAQSANADQLKKLGDIFESIKKRLPE